ncbi:MAG: methyltransferase [Rhodanobacteraceae bacterium]|nr:MAG: methyltransferase [Rhodanobacteraceae bacterium]
MRCIGIAVMGALLLPLAATAQTHPDWSMPVAAHVKVPAYISKAMNDPARAADKKDDVRRQMAAVLTFSGIKPGDKVMELIPATGYWTRAFSQIVKPDGHVYTIWSSNTKPDNKNWVNWEKLVKTPHYSDVTMLKEYMGKPHAPVPVDIVFTADNYHDLHDPFWGPQHKPLDMAEFNKAVYAALKPGGVFVIVDHIAPAGSGTRDTDTLHRIDPAVVKKEVEAAGFVFDGSSDALVNPKDPLTIKVFDPAVRGHTSQFIYRFRKPAK